MDCLDINEQVMDLGPQYFVVVLLAEMGTLVCRLVTRAASLFQEMWCKSLYFQCDLSSQ